jgi:nitrate reductase delta subunit
MIKTYKILSLFLSYPGQDLQDFLHEGTEELRREGLLEETILTSLEEFASHFSGMDLIDWQAHYVILFDISRNTSLYIFEHLSGDSKERGQAMADLLDFYNGEGFEMKTGELPDYLPAFLEFLSSLDKQKASELLSQPVDVINRIYSVLRESNSIYRHVFKAVISLSPVMPDKEDFKYTAGNIMNAGFDELYQEPPALSGESTRPEI